MTVAGIVEGGDAVYGINTGFGQMADTLIPQDALATLQSNLVLSHTVGSGAPLSLPETRLVMALKIASLAQGYSGVRPELVDLMIAMVNHDDGLSLCFRSHQMLIGLLRSRHGFRTVPGDVRELLDLRKLVSSAVRQAGGPVFGSD